MNFYERCDLTKMYFYFTDRIGGVSIGSFIGGLWAIHRNFDKVESLAKEWFALIKYGYIGHIKNFTYPHNSMFTGDYFNDTVKKIIGEHIMIEDLWIPYFCCTTDISSLGNNINTGSYTKVNFTIHNDRDVKKVF